MDTYIINTYKTERGDKFRMDYVTGYVIPTVKKFINKEVKDLNELKMQGYSPIWDTRNNVILKKILEHLLDITLTGVVKKDKITLQEYLSA